MKLYVLVMIVLLCMPFALSDGGYLNETTRIWSDVVSGSSFYNSANATLDIYDSSGSTIQTDINMSKFSTGIYYYDFTPSQTGNYYATVSIRNSTNDVVGVGSETIFILNNDANAYEALVQYFGSQTMWENIILIGIFILLYIVGFTVKSEVLIFGAGLVAFAMAIQLTIFSVVAFNVIFAILLGLGAIYHGILMLLKKK